MTTTRDRATARYAWAALRRGPAAPPPVRRRAPGGPWPAVVRAQQPEAVAVGSRGPSVGAAVSLRLRPSASVRRLEASMPPGEFCRGRRRVRDRCAPLLRQSASVKHLSATSAGPICHANQPAACYVLTRENRTMDEHIPTLYSSFAKILPAMRRRL